MEAMGIIFSNIYDNNMGELTRERTSASIPFGSRYRQIDFALSNMANSKISNIGIVTKYNYQSLMDHLGNCEEWDLKLGEGVRFLPPYATGHTGAYRGKLEALQTAMPVLDRCDAEYVVLSDTTVLCAINFAAVLDEHIASGCDITVIAKAGYADGKRRQPLAVKLGEDGKIVDLAVDYCAPSDYLVGARMYNMDMQRVLQARLFVNGNYVALIIEGEQGDREASDEDQAKFAASEAAKVDAAWSAMFGSADNSIVIPADSGNMNMDEELEGAVGTPMLGG